MKRIAIVGFGNHVRKNILPALSRASDLLVGNIYVRDVDKYSELALELGVAVQSLDSKIADVDAVYISTPISTHYEYAKKYLNEGLNVICEKPLTSSIVETEELFAIAAENDARLLEVCMYQYHTQFEHLKNTVVDNKSRLRSFSVKFSIPHLEQSNIRYKKQSGGGALLDVGYYPLSLVSTVFGGANRINSGCFSQADFEVDLTGYASFEYDGFYGTAEWGIGVPYENEVELVFEDKSVTYSRIFSKPESLDAAVIVKRGFDTEVIQTGKDDHFVNMFKQYLCGKKTDVETNRTLQIAKVINSIRLCSEWHD